MHGMDLRGHGRSEGPRGDVRSFDDYPRHLDVFFERSARRRLIGRCFSWEIAWGG